MGRILLQGGGEFGGRMVVSDREALRLAGGAVAAVRIIPTAAAPDGNHGRAGNNGVAWFGRLGCSDVRSVPLIDRRSADSSAVCEAIAGARLVVILGGFPGYLASTLKGTAALKAIVAVYRSGGVIAGSSAGAMVLFDTFFDPETNGPREGLGLLSGGCLIPHYDTVGRKWVPSLRKSLPGRVLVGVDEETGMIDDGTLQRWRVLGKGGVTLHRGGQEPFFESREGVVVNLQPEGRHGAR
jgi:cyanophycinase